MANQFTVTQDTDKPDDYLELGADWLQEMSERFARQNVVLKWTNNGQTFTAGMTASLVDEEGRLIRGQAKLKIENTFFLFTHNELLTAEVPLRRGLIIEWNNRSFEAVLQGDKCYFFNDTHRRTTVIVTKQCT